MSESKTKNIPEGLHELEYARHFLEEMLGWPAKGNLELMGDCLRSIAKSRSLTLKQSYSYLLRAVTLAKKQQITVDKFFFQDGKYTEVRPEKSTVRSTFDVVDRKAIEAEQATPEWQAASDQAREMLKKLASDPKFVTKRAGA